MEPQVKTNQVESHFEAALMNVQYLLKLNPYYSSQKDHEQSKLAFTQIMSALVIAFEKEKEEKKEETPVLSNVKKEEKEEFTAVQD